MQVPEELIKYINILKSIEMFPKGDLDKEREILHEKLLKIYNINRGSSLEVTNNLDRFEYNIEQIHFALNELPKIKKEKEVLPYCIFCGTPKNVKFIRTVFESEVRALKIAEGTKRYRCGECFENILIHPKYGRYGSKY